MKKKKKKQIAYNRPTETERIDYDGRDEKKKQGLALIRTKNLD